MKISSTALVPATLAALLGACSSSHSTLGNPCTSSADCSQGEACSASGACVSSAEPDAGAQGCTAVAVPWLAEGNFWQVAWSEVDYQVGLFETTSSYDLGSYSMKLGAPVSQAGKQMFPIQLGGDTRKYKPLWTSIGTDGCGAIYGGDGSRVVRIYSLTDSGWTGSSFWTPFTGYPSISVQRGASVIPSSYSRRVSDIFAPPITSVGYSTAQSGIGAGHGCEYFEGYGTLCTGDSPGASTHQFIYEYWAAKAGPIAMAYAYDYDSGDSPRTRHHTEKRADVWFFGDVVNNSYRFEQEPDSCVAATPITLPGDKHLFSVFGEISNYDKPAGAIPGVSAVISDAVYAQIKSWYPFDQTTGQNIAVQIQDWFSFEIVDTQQRAEIYLVWDDDAQLELHWFAAPDNATYGFMYFGQDSIDIGTELPEFKHKKGIPNPMVAGKYLLGVRRTAPAQFSTPYGIMAMQ